MYWVFRNRYDDDSGIGGSMSYNVLGVQIQIR